MKAAQTVLLMSCMMLFTATSIGASQFTQLCITDASISFKSNESHHDTCQPTPCCEEGEAEDNCLDLELQDADLQTPNNGYSSPIIKTFTASQFHFNLSAPTDKVIEKQSPRFYDNALSPPATKLNSPLTSFKKIRLIL